jgi:putative ABC transport system permease protein
MVYLSASQGPHGSFYVRTNAGTRAMRDMIRPEIGAIDKTAQFEGVRPFETTVNDMISQERLTAVLSALFAALAVLLAAVGMYGVMAYNVSRRTNEFGIRMALGAQRGDVQRLVLRQTLVLVAAGLGVGTIAAIALARSLSAAIIGMLYGVSPQDIVDFMGGAGLLAAVALLAAFLPARRASRTDPMIALRYE